MKTDEINQSVMAGFAASDGSAAAMVLQARRERRCRICHGQISAKNCPMGWEDQYGEMLWPEHVILNFGQEFAHAKCLTASPPATTG